MENPKELIKHEPRKSLIIMGVISLGLIVFGGGFYIAGLEINDALTRQLGIILVVMGVIGGILYLWGRKHPSRKLTDKSGHSSHS